jgi:hypothetical protein
MLHLNITFFFVSILVLLINKFEMLKLLINLNLLIDFRKSHLFSNGGYKNARIFSHSHIL